MNNLFSSQGMLQDMMSMNAQEKGYEIMDSMLSKKDAVGTAKAEALKLTSRAEAEAIKAASADKRFEILVDKGIPVEKAMKIAYGIEYT